MPHSFFKYCINNTVFERVRNISQFVKALHEQAKLEQAMVPYRENIDRLPQEIEDELKDGKMVAPRYFGAGVEALAECYFNEFGMSMHNLSSYVSQDTIDDDKEDTGYDAIAVNTKRKQFGTVIQKICESGSIVYIQVKGKVNPRREHMTNDTSRIPNFYANAQSEARKRGEAYTARYILFTTGKGMHWRLEKMTNKDIEVVNYSMINRLTKDNEIFWNIFRRNIGLTEIPISGPKDANWMSMQSQIAKEKAAADDDNGDE